MSRNAMTRYEPRWLPDGMLDMSICPRCEMPTELRVQSEGDGFPITRMWRCDTCNGWWRQVGYRDAVWVQSWIGSRCLGGEHG